MGTEDNCAGSTYDLNKKAKNPPTETISQVFQSPQSRNDAGHRGSVTFFFRMRLALEYHHFPQVYQKRPVNVSDEKRDQMVCPDMRIVIEFPTGVVFPTARYKMRRH